MRRFLLSIALAAVASAPCCGAWAEPTFVNGLVIPGDTLDATRKPGANAGRFGFFSDIYYDPVRDEWWALSDRGPGGGVLDYATRVQRFTLDVHPVTGRISQVPGEGDDQVHRPEGIAVRADESRGRRSQGAERSEPARSERQRGASSAAASIPKGWSSIRAPATSSSPTSTGRRSTSSAARASSSASSRRRPTSSRRSPAR